MENNELRVGEGFVAVLLDGVELDAVTGAELHGLVGQGEADASGDDPADLGVIVVDLGPVDLGAFGAEPGGRRRWRTSPDGI